MAEPRCFSCSSGQKDVLRVDQGEFWQARVPPWDPNRIHPPLIDPNGSAGGADGQVSQQQVRTTTGVRKGPAHGTWRRNPQHVGHLEGIGVAHDGPPGIKSIHPNSTGSHLNRVERNPLLFSTATWAIDPLMGAIAVVNKLANSGQRGDHVPIRRRHFATVVTGKRLNCGTEGSDVGPTEFVAAVQLGPPPERQQDRRGQQQTGGHPKKIRQPKLEPATKTTAGRDG